MTPSKLTQSVLKKIKTQQVRPRARWQFVFRRSTIALGGLLFLALGVLAAAAMIHAITMLDWGGAWGRGPNVFFQFFWIGIPVFWLASFGFLWWAANFFVRRTGKAYKIPVWTGMLVLFFLQILGGAILHHWTMGERIEQAAVAHVPFYRGMEDVRRRIWHRPSEGFLAGTVQKVSKDKILILEDFSQKIWSVDFELAEIYPEMKLLPGQKIRTLGTKTGKETFRAEYIRPWHKPRFQRPMRSSDTPLLSPWNEKKRQDF
ncbi:MAG: hypothetical protein K9M51_01530 [Candidatus Gracilibacteria bacterium]|nr:hypothetical protein [Candidatus Gracilibacteria bacterium]